MIRFENNASYVEVIVDKTTLPEQYWPSYRRVTIMKDDVGSIALDINDNQVTITFRDGEVVDLKHEIIDASHSCASNEDLYNLLKGYLVT